MIFQSFNFLLIFLPITVLTYYLSPNNHLRNSVLIIASFLFYAWGNILWAMLLIGASIVDFIIAQKIHNLNLKLEEKLEHKTNKSIEYQKKLLLIFSIIFNIGLLSYFKYWDWLVESIGTLTHYDLNKFQHRIPFPPAISFYTFETLSYSIDIYRRQFRPTRNFTD
jgi:alginate O-acetyltransferase complex protein AlgI